MARDPIKRKAYLKAYKEAHRERMNELKRAYHRRHADEINARKRQERLENPDKVRAKAQEYRQRTRDQRLEWQKRYNEKTSEQRRIKAQQYRKDNVTKIADYRQRKHYGITLDDKRAMLEAQGNRCAICAKELTWGASVVCTDHCHDTGQVRGILCTGCNKNIGILETWFVDYQQKIQTYLFSTTNRSKGSY